MKLKEYIQVIRPYLTQRKFIKNQSEHTPELKDTIVSLTSIPARYKTLTPVIASLLNQDTPPHSVHLWIQEGTKNQLPDSLAPLLDRGFVIHECDHIGPHSKLIHSLEEYPDFKIVTADDDMIYHHHWLSTLHKEHILYPEDISAYTCRQIKVTGDPLTPRPYREWTRINDNTNHSHPHYLSIGFTGVLYPPKVFNNEVFNLDAIHKLCPRADDIWFKFMAVLNQKKHRKIKAEFGKEIYLPFTQSVGLKNTNVKKMGNEDQAKNLMHHYELEGYFLNE